MSFAGRTIDSTTQAVPLRRLHRFVGAAACVSRTAVCRWLSGPGGQLPGCASRRLPQHHASRSRSGLRDGRCHSEVSPRSGMDVPLCRRLGSGTGISPDAPGCSARRSQARQDLEQFQQPSRSCRSSPCTGE